MAEKRVSVRLGAEGGRQVRSEFEGVGRSGDEAFDKVGRSADRTNQQLAAFARRAKIAAAAIATATVAAGVAMVRSGLQTIDAQAKLAASLGTTVESMQILERAGDLAGVSMGQVEQATIQLTRRLSQAASGTGPAVAALDRLKLSAEDLQALPLDERIAVIQGALEQFVPEAERASVASQLFGDRAGLVFTRIDTATLRTATRDVRDFGVAVSQDDAAQIERTNDALSRLGLVWRGFANQLTVAVAPVLEGLANAMAAAARAAGPFGSALGTVLDNLDRLGAYAAVAAGALAISLAPAAIAATVAVAGMTRALLASRAAMVRTGWGVAVLALGELAYRSGLFAGAADEVTEAQGRMNDALNIFAQDSGPGARAEAVAATKDYIANARAKLESAEASLRLMEAYEQEYRSSVLMSGVEIPAQENAMAENVAAARDEVVKLRAEIIAASTRLKELEDADPAAPVNVATRATNQLTSSLGGAVARAQQLTAALGQAPAALRSLEEQAKILDAGLAAAERGADANEVALKQFRAEKELQYGLAEADPASRQEFFILETINNEVAMKKAVLERQQALDGYISQLNRVETAAGSAGGAAKAALEAAGEAAQTAADNTSKMTNSLQDYALNAIDLQKGVNETITKGFQGAEGAIRQFVMTGKADFKSLVRSILADLAVLVARRTILGPLASALSGVFGGGIGGVREFGNPLVTASVYHRGGEVGAAGMRRDVSPHVFANAPRFHNGIDLNLRPDEVPSILQRGERVWSRDEVRRGADRDAARQEARVVVELRGDMLDARVAEGADRVVLRRAPGIVRESVAAVRTLSSESRKFLG
jgi:lambda family phage tail tape measure protein